MESIGGFGGRGETIVLAAKGSSPQGEGGSAFPVPSKNAVLHVIQAEFIRSDAVSRLRITAGMAQQNTNETTRRERHR